MMGELVLNFCKERVERQLKPVMQQIIENCMLCAEHIWKMWDKKISPSGKIFPQCHTIRPESLAGSWQHCPWLQVVEQLEDEREKHDENLVNGGVAEKKNRILLTIQEIRKLQ